MIEFKRLTRRESDGFERHGGCCLEGCAFDWIVQIILYRYVGCHGICTVDVL